MHRALVLLLMTETFAAAALAQSLTPVSRQGANLAYCGPLGGPLINHQFSTLEPTDDSVAVEDSGPPASAAMSHLISSVAGTSILIDVSGSAMRGAPPASVGAVADAREGWEFTIDATACFTFGVSLTAVGTNDVIAGQTYAFTAVSSGAQILLDPGSDALSGALTAAGSLTRSASGRLLPGRYAIGITGRADTNHPEPNNFFPYNGSYANSITLRLGLSEDINADGFVDIADLSVLLAHFGVTGASHDDGDLNGDETVNLSDLTQLLGAFGNTCD